MVAFLEHKKAMFGKALISMDLHLEDIRLRVTLPLLLLQFPYPKIIFLYEILRQI